MLAAASVASLVTLATLMVSCGGDNNAAKPRPFSGNDQPIVVAGGSLQVALPNDTPPNVWTADSHKTHFTHYIGGSPSTLYVAGVDIYRFDANGDPEAVYPPFFGAGPVEITLSYCDNGSSAKCSSVTLTSNLNGQGQGLVLADNESGWNTDQDDLSNNGRSVDHAKGKDKRLDNIAIKVNGTAIANSPFSCKDDKKSRHGRCWMVIHSCSKAGCAP